LIDTGRGLLRREKRHLEQPDVDVRTEFGVKTPPDLIQMHLVRVTHLYWNDTGAWGRGEVSLPEATDAGAGLVEIWILAPRAHFNEKECHRQAESAVDLAARIDPMIEHIAVVGAGYMGGGIAQVFALAGMDVVIVDADPNLTARHLDRLRHEAQDFENRGLFDPGSAERVRKNLRASDSVAAAVAEADLIEEAVLERPEVKGPVLRSIESAAPPEAVIGSNTSTLPIGDLAAGLDRPQRFLGIHFSNPAPFIPGVELIAHSGTDEDVIEAVEALVPVTGKLTARVRDKAGFVLNRLQYVLLKEAINLVEEGVATPEDVDTIVRTTFGYRLPFFGPFAIADMAGLDVYRDGFRTLQQHYGERLAAPKMLTELVSAGQYGLKQGGGFVTPSGDQAPLVAYRNTAYARLGQLLKELGPAPKGRDE
jgi:3-hydroxybutyryl-CoA dehydrogenase